MTTPDMLDERYGRTRSARRAWTIGVIAVLATGALGALVWMTIANSIDDVTADSTGYVVEDDRTLTLTFQITAPQGSTVACALEAQDEDHGIVGWRIVRVEASDLHARAFRETIPTVARATTGLVNSCWVT